MELTEVEQQAARDVAEDRLSDEQIAERNGISRSTLARLKKRDDFNEYVRDVKAELAAETRRLFGVRKHDRLAVLSEQLDSLVKIRDARRRAYALREVVRLADGVEVLPEYDPGADARAHFTIGDPCESGKETGYLVPKYTVVGTGKNQRIVESWGVDRDLAGEIRATIDSIAAETGDRSAAGADDRPVRQYVGVAIEAV